MGSISAARKDAALAATLSRFRERLDSGVAFSAQELAEASHVIASGYRAPRQQDLLPGAAD